MKNLLFIAALFTAFVSCSKNTTLDDVQIPNELHVIIAQEESRMQLLSEKTVWTERDKVSVFYKSDANDCWTFQGNTGDRSGNLICEYKGTATTATDKVIIVYPYNENYELKPEQKLISLLVPSVQHYAKDSYGVGSSIMVSLGLSDSFILKNVCGWLKLPITGNKTISKIVLKGNNLEQLAGKAMVEYDNLTLSFIDDKSELDDTQVGGTLIFDNEYASELTLNCDDGIVLSYAPKNFYISLVPQTFVNGLTITINYTDGTIFEKSTANSIEIRRNHISQMEVIKTDDNEINIDNVVNLSEKGVANCYIVSRQGSYKFSISPYSASSAFLLWNENGDDDIISVNTDGDYVYFTKPNYNKGNAMISITDDKGNIIWSYHIWCTDEPQTTSVNGVEWMDRNLGATDIIPNSSNVYGLLYNPGNPFPFPGQKYNWEISETPSVPDGWYVAKGYGFYKSSSMPSPACPMQLCTRSDVFGNSIYYRIGYKQCPYEYHLPNVFTFQNLLGYEPQIIDNGTYPVDNLYIPCIKSTSYSQYLCSGHYNDVSVDTNTIVFYNGVSRRYYCTGAAMLPIRCCK